MEIKGVRITLKRDKLSELISKPAREILDKVVARLLHGYKVADKAKLVAKRGRKATGLLEIAGLPSKVQR
jgi:hypothetical protein